jgi:hypothetical protein
MCELDWVRYTREHRAILRPITEDTAAISAELRKHTSAPIVSYHREDDGTIDVWTDGDGLYTARNIRGKWKLAKAIVLT